MRWRCEWCGKPHEENDPPCDNCGHGTFEEAVVQQAGAGDGQDSMLVWVCTECGREHAKNSPPCSRCNNATFERQEKVVTDGNLTDGPNAESVASIEQETMTVWVCQNCGKEHTKNNPPCDRCGTATFDRETKTISDDELTIPGYLDLVTPRYAAVLGVVLLIAVVFGLGAAGVVDLPFFPDNSVPEVENVPGNESSVNGIALGDVERSYFEEFTERRAGTESGTLERSAYLDDVATYYNQRRIKSLLRGGNLPTNEQLTDLLSEECSATPSLETATVRVQAGSSPETLGTQLANSVAVDTPGTVIGIDIHAVENELILSQFVCVR